ncbi:MAG: hypothetical protein Q4D98_09030 [Planctomycetia bacterium]|nr:hypothetical protein [Planctomycetia bacterium]
MKIFPGELFILEKIFFLFLFFRPQRHFLPQKTFFVNGRKPLKIPGGNDFRLKKDHFHHSLDTEHMFALCGPTSEHMFAPEYSLKYRKNRGFRPLFLFKTGPPVVSKNLSVFRGEKKF